MSLTSQEIIKYEHLVFDEAWHDVTNSKDFIKQVNIRIRELIQEKMKSGVLKK